MFVQESKKTLCFFKILFRIINIHVEQIKVKCKVVSKMKLGFLPKMFQTD